MKSRWTTVEVITIIVAFALVGLWVSTHYVNAIFGINFDKNFTAQLGNMAMLALGVLGISKSVSREDRTDPKDKGKE